jgi:hypothetical protein
VRGGSGCAAFNCPGIHIDINAPILLASLAGAVIGVRDIGTDTEHMNSAKWDIVPGGQVTDYFVSATAAQLEVLGSAAGLVRVSLDFENVIVIALQPSDGFIELRNFVFRKLRLIQTEEEAFGGYMLEVVEVPDEVGQSATSLVGHRMRFVRTRPCRISARLGLLSSLSSGASLPIGFHRAFVDTRDVIFDIA